MRHDSDCAARYGSGLRVDLPILALPFVLSLIAGSTDVIGFLGLNDLFTAHITGNLVILAAHVVAGNPAILSHVLSVPVFMLVLLLTRLFAGYLEHRGIATLQPLLLLQLLSLIAFVALCTTGGAQFNAQSAVGVVAAMFGVTGMAVQTALVQITLKNAPSTAVMTTNIARFMMAVGEAVVADDEVSAAQARTRAIHILPVIVGFALGCALGAAAEEAYGLWSLSLPTGLALLAMVMSVLPGTKDIK
jgi:uncharacterized membrane protein YoaK (UPF0700 family)